MIKAGEYLVKNDRISNGDFVEAQAKKQRFGTGELQVPRKNILFF